MPRKRVLTINMSVRQPGQKVALVRPPSKSPEQGTNTTGRIRFGAKARKEFPRLASAWANDLRTG